MAISRSTFEASNSNLKGTSYGPEERNKSINESESSESDNSVQTKTLSKKSRTKTSLSVDNDKTLSNRELDITYERDF